jgi:hypothetical protein
MIEVSAGITIAAPAETVWSILIDLPRYSEWNPFIRRAWGSLEVGGTVHVRVRPPSRIPLGFHARILGRDEHRELRWRGTVGGAWLGSGDHRFVIQPIGDRRVTFLQVEQFGGVLPRIARRLLEREAHAGFDAMNRALAERAERAWRAAETGARATC